MQNRCLVSVAMTVYNGEQYLEQQLKSIIEQSYSNIEIIVVDDGSKDASLNILNRLAAIDSRIKIYQNPYNLGVVANLLRAVSLASGEYICCCDQDDYWRKDRIEILKKLIEEDEENMFAYSDLEICDKNLGPIYDSYLAFTRTSPKRGYLRGLSFLKNIVTGAAVMFRKKVRDILILLPADVPFMHDHLVLILSSGLGKIVYSKEKLVKYRQHSGNVIGAFYPSVIDKSRIIKELREKLTYFKRLSFSNLNLNLAKMFEFCDCLETGSIFKRLSFMRYYLFLRKDTLKDKLLGFFECLMPKSYARARKMKRLLRPFGACNDVTFSMWIMRTLFITWVFIVLLFFTKEFVFYKVVKFLEYIK